MIKKQYVDNEHSNSNEYIHRFRAYPKKPVEAKLSSNIVQKFPVLGNSIKSIISINKPSPGLRPS
jgi:hypothetical protein